MKIERYLDRQQSTVRPIFVSSYVPRKCGIATFTKDLTKALNDLNPDGLSEIIAIEDGVMGMYYPWEVKYKISQHELGSYYQAAEYVNQSSADVVCLQHEYGLFGGNDGEHVLSFLRHINKPIITTLHSVLEKPCDNQKAVLQVLGELSKTLVVMVPEAKESLVQNYGIDKEKIVVIHHGVADCPKSNKSHKKAFRWQDKRIMLSSGLLSRGKGFEYVIESLPKILEEFPNTYFYIVGQTHPDILKKEGERYRKSLINLAKKLNVEKNLVFVNKYLPLDKLLRYYEACDIYLTPHLDQQQSSSGTLAYALGMGKVCISTPYLYAKRVLSDDQGILVDFKNSQEISEAALSVFRDDELEEKISNNAYALGRTMCWPRVAQRYLNLFRYAIETEKNWDETSPVSD